MTRQVGAVLGMLFLAHAATAQFVQQGSKLVGTGIVGTASQGSSVAISADGNTAIVSGSSDQSNAGAAGGLMSVYTPPACVPGVPFADITCTTGFDPWIEQFGLDGITAGCGGGNYCPGTPVTRDQMAVFLEKAMRGTSNWPPHTVLLFHHQAAEANSDVNSGTELLSVVAAIPSTGSEAPSASTPWLIKVGPGIYDLGSGSLVLPVYTALEGAGQDITVIIGTGSADSGQATVIMGDRGRLSRLAVYSWGDNTWETAVYIPPLASRVALEHVALTANNPSNDLGVAYGLYAETNTSFSLIDSSSVSPGNSWRSFSTYCGRQL